MAQKMRDLFEYPHRRFNSTMPRRLSIAMVVIVVLACAGTTCLYSGAGPMDPQTAAAGGGWSPWLAAIADLLTVPIPTLGIAASATSCSSSRSG